MLTDGPHTITLGYDGLGRRASLTHANGTRTTAGYDLASRLTGLTHATGGGTPLQSFTYGYDAADSRTSLTTLAQSLGYGYDLANRLTGVTATPGSPIPAETFTYDRVGNRLTGPGSAASYTYNAGHHLLSGPGTSYAYDLTGNRTAKTDATGTTTYTWDAVNRLVQAVVPTATGTTTVSYAYDALGRRVRTAVAQTTGGTTTTRTTEYVYDGEDILVAVETTDTGGTPTTTTTRYVHGPGIDEPLLVEDGGQGYAVHADALGSVTGLSDASQTVAEVSTYTSFGELSRSGTVTGNAYAYTGREWEPELGLYYYRARYYDPEAGRFVSRDPIGFAGGDTNLYSYVFDDPTNAIDPDGEAIRTLRNIRRFYQDARRLRLEGHQRFPGEDNSYVRHFVISDDLTKCYGPVWTWLAGAANEFQGLILHDIPDLPARIRGQRPWAFSIDDFVANQHGIRTASEDIQRRKRFVLDRAADRTWGYVDDVRGIPR